MVAITLAKLGLHETSLGVMEQIRMTLELDILHHSTPITWVMTNLFLFKLKSKNEPSHFHKIAIDIKEHGRVLTIFFFFFFFFFF